MQKARFIIALAVFLFIAFAIPFLANLLPDHTRTLANAPEIISKAYIDRVVNYMVCGKKPDIVVAGSSLVIFPHVLTDGYFEKAPVPIPDPIEYADFLTNYVEMAHFKRVLSVKANSVVDLGVPSLMLTDCDLLFEKMQMNESLPRVAILMLAPRDFMDNTVAVDRNLFLHEVAGRNTLKEIFNSGSAGLFQAKLIQSMSYGANAWAKQFRSGGQRVLLAVRKLGRKPKAISTGSISHEQALHYFYFGDGKMADLGVYKKRYNPPDYARIKEQITALGRVLDRLKSASVKTIVVSMPLTRENVSLIAPSAYEEIQNGMKTTCAEKSVAFLAADDLGRFEKSDFVDSVHLNAEGGDRFFKQLAKLIGPDLRSVFRL